MPLIINGEVVPGEEFVHDGCHKFYVVTNDESRENLLYKGWNADGFRPVAELPELWEQSCPLRFIHSADLVDTYVSQDDSCEDWVTVEYREES